MWKLAQEVETTVKEVPPEVKAVERLELRSLRLPGSSALREESGVFAVTSPLSLYRLYDYFFCGLNLAQGLG